MQSYSNIYKCLVVAWQVTKYLYLVYQVIAWFLGNIFSITKIETGLCDVKVHVIVVLNFQIESFLNLSIYHSYVNQQFLGRCIVKEFFYNRCLFTKNFWKKFNVMIEITAKGNSKWN